MPAGRYRHDPYNLSTGRYFIPSAAATPGCICGLMRRRNPELQRNLACKAGKMTFNGEDVVSIVLVNLPDRFYPKKGTDYSPLKEVLGPGVIEVRPNDVKSGARKKCRKRSMAFVWTVGSSVRAVEEAARRNGLEVGTGDPRQVCCCRKKK